MESSYGPVTKQIMESSYGSVTKHIIESSYGAVTKQIMESFIHMILKQKKYAISSDTHQLQFIKLHHFKQKRF